MKILGYTDQDEYIICVSRQEWESLNDGIRPLGDMSHWHSSEVYRELNKRKLPGLGWRRLYFAFKEQQFDGTWESLEALLQSGTHLDSIGERGRKILADVAKELINAR